MADKKYPVGTKIKYIGIHRILFEGEKFTGMIGKVVGIEEGYPLIYLPKATAVSQYSTKKRPATIQTAWCRIEKLVQKNEQLLFSFVEK